MGTFVPNTKAEQQKMLESCGFQSFDEMYSCIPEELRLKNGITPETLRLSVGIENVEDLIADLEQALN